MHGWNFPHQPNMNPGKGGRLGAITFSNSPEAMLCTPLPPLHQTLGPGASLAVSTPLRTERPVLMVGGSGGHSQSFARLISSHPLVEMGARGNLM